jgi:multidrug efflux pump subunit AcrB
MEDEGMDRLQATKEGIGKIAMPIIPRSRLAAFVPLGLWPSYGTIYGLFSHNAFCRGLFVVCSHL